MRGTGARIAGRRCAVGVVGPTKPFDFFAEAGAVVKFTTRPS